MTKKGPLGKAEEFYIEHHYKAMEIDEICKELDRAKSLVKRCVTKCKDKEESDSVLTAGSQFAHQGGATVMTQNASELSDVARQNNTIAPRQEHCVTRIK